MRHAILMAGGSGTRFWPRSRRAKPKQFLSLLGGPTLLQETAARLDGLIPAAQRWVVAGPAYADLIREQLPDLPAAQLLIEPVARNTAPCVGLAAIAALAQDPDATLVLLPADHLITPQATFQQAIERACDLVEAEPQRLVLLGAQPTRPATGFGYIEQGQPLDDRQPPAMRVTRFREKPNAATAAEYLAAGRFSWNCGIFVWKARTILAELAAHEPAIAAGCEQLLPLVGTPAFDEQLRTSFPQWPSISIDYAVLERAADVVMVAAEFQWNDVGTWDALFDVLPADGHGNVIVGRHAGVQTSGCLIQSLADAGQTPHLVATAGVQDLIIVHTPSATLVARRGDEAAIKALLGELTRRGFDGEL